MSNYAQTTFFTPKDALPPSDPGKTIFGAAYDVEFGNIATAISSKFDSTSIAAAPVAFNIGTAALPGITFVGHTGTGLFSNANGDLGLSANGIQRLITSGTTGGLVIAAPTSAATALVINTIGSSAGIQVNLAGSSSIGIRIIDGGANNTVLDLNTNNTEANLKASGTSSQLSFFTAGTSRITITNAGGLFTNGATGGDQGSGTINATGLFVNGVATSVSVGANPTASLGLTAINGVATTFMRSDAAPALSQSIVPTWTGVHTFSARIAANLGMTVAGGTFISRGISDSATATAITINSSAAVSIAAPSAGTALAITGFSGSTALTITPGGVTDNAIAILAPAAGNANIQFQINATPQSIIGVAGAAGQLITGSVLNDLCIRSLNGKINFAGSTNSSIQVQIDGNGNIIASNGTGSLVGPIYAGIPQNIQNATYAIVLTDANKNIHKSGGIAHTDTLPANASVAFPIGTAITFTVAAGAANLTLAITTDTLLWSPSGTTGSRTIAANGVATALKITATSWVLTGTGIT